MKILNQILFLLAFLFFTNQSYAQWANLGGPEKGQVEEFLNADGITYAVTEDGLTKYDENLGKWVEIAQGGEKSFAVCNDKLYAIIDEGLIEIDEDGNKVRDVIPTKSKVYEVYGANKLLIVKSSLTTFQSSIDNGVTWTNFNSVISYDKNFGIRYINGMYLIWAKRVFAYSDNAMLWTSVNPSLFFNPEYILDVVYDAANKFYISDTKSILEFNPSNFEQEKFVYPPFFKNGSDYTISAMDMYKNILFLSSENNGIYYRTANGFWHSANEGLETLDINAMAFAGDYIYAGANAVVYRKKIKDLDLQLKMGEVFYDLNKNGKKDGDERNARKIDLQNTKGQLLGNTNKMGEFSFFSPSLSKDSVNVRPSSLYNPTNGPFALNTNENIQLGIEPLYKFDAAINLTIDGFTPGLPATLTIVASEQNNDESNQGYYQLYYPKGIKLGKIIPETYFKTDQFIEWRFNDFNTTRPNTAFVEIIADPSTPIGKEFCFEGKMFLYNSEINLSNNVATLCSSVVESTEANVKQVNAPSVLDEKNVDNHPPLIYTIRFQNTGNDKAVFVRITDTLSNNVDVNSFKLLSSSYELTYKIKDGVVEFYFDSINMEGSEIDQVLSHGFVKYSVDLKKGLTAGDAIDNTAYIYFDYNAPDKTNKVSIAIDQSNGQAEQIAKGFSLYPNPVGNILKFNTNNKIDKVDIYDEVGRIILTTSVQNNAIDVSSLRDGIYFLKVYADNKVTMAKMAKN
jgi:uncharacterized repeat protein (TIGR01451 family)